MLNLGENKIMQAYERSQTMGHFLRYFDYL